MTQSAEQHVVASEVDRPRWLRPMLILLGLPNVLTGVWAIGDPQGWYDNFPGWSPRLVAALPPFNEHLATDAGAGLLATGLLALLAAWQPRRDVVVTAMVGYLAFALPHAAYHLANPAEALSAGEDMTNVISLWLAVVAAGAALFAGLKTPHFLLSSTSD
ncbi:MAG: hypothetical protein ACRBK7_30855 [Acidimicrobiales bacterium]